MKRYQIKSSYCLSCRCIYDDKAIGAQGRNGDCKCTCGHISPQSENGGQSGSGRKIHDVKGCQCADCFSQPSPSERQDILQEIRGKVMRLRNRFRCASCDGSKCEHTNCCQALNELLKELK